MGANKVSSTGAKVKSSCPLAFARHAKGRDSHPSFVVFVQDNDVSKCKCLSAGCGFHGDLISLAVAFIDGGRKLSPYWIDVVEKNRPDPLKVHEDKYDKIEQGFGDLYRLNDKNRIPAAVEGGLDVNDFLQVIDGAANIERHRHYVTEMQEELTKNYDAYNYLIKERGLSEKAIKDWSLGYHPGARRIAIPQFDRNNKLLNIGGRYLDSVLDPPWWEPVPWMHAKDFKKENYLFGEDKITSFIGSETGVLVEGMFDAIYLSDRGISNCLAMLGSYLGRYQVMKLLRWFDRIIIVPDGDDPGMDAAHKAKVQLEQKIHVEIYPTPDGKDPDNLTDSELDELKSQVGFDK